MKNSAIILSGGSGKRLGSPIPKQYLEVGGKPLLSYTLAAFQKSQVDEIVIVAASDYQELCRHIASENGITKFQAVISGGSERYDSVMNGLEYLYHRESGDIVLIHDGARPFVTVDTINEVIEQVKQHGAAIAATPCTDTIKIADAKGMILSTTDRSCTWAAQTPQGFWLEDIFRAYRKILYGADNDLQQNQVPITKITDDAMVYQLAYPDKPVKAVLSDSTNLKITRPIDLVLAEKILTLSL